MIRTSSPIPAVACAAIALLIAPVRAADPPAPAAYTLEHALTLVGYSGLAWSADGRRLAFVATTQDTAENTTNADIWVKDFATGAPPLQLTRHAKSDNSPTFSPGGDTLAFIANRGTGDDAKPAIWMISLRGGEAWAYGTTPEGVSEVQWSPDGRFLAYVMSDTLPKQVKEWRKKKWDHVVEDQVLQWPRLWVVELATGERRQLTTGPLWIWNIRWAPDSRGIAFITSPSGSPDDENAQDLGVVDVTGGAVRTLGVIGTEFAWSPDSRSIAFANGADRRVFIGKNDLWVVPAAGGTPRNLTAAFDEDARRPMWSPDGAALHFHSAQNVTTRLASVPAAGGPVTLGVDLRGEAGDPLMAANGRVAWTQSSPRKPGEVWAAERAGEAGAPVTAGNAAIEALPLGDTRAVTWKSSDGQRIEGLLLRPPGAAPGAKLRTLVLLHGGPYTSRYALGFQAAPMWMAVNGYQVFMPNFRSSGGYGTKFMVRERADIGGQDWRDVMTGVDSLVQAGLADPDRMGVYGGSYGGHLSAWAITQTDRFKCASVAAGGVDFASLFGQSDIHRYRAYEFRGFPWQDPKAWAEDSPITHIAKAKTPTLILVGEDDRRVPMPQSQQLYTALKFLGVPVEFVHYPREGHGLREYRHRWDYTTRQKDWFDRYLR